MKSTASVEAGLALNRPLHREARPVALRVLVNGAVGRRRSGSSFESLASAAQRVAPKRPPLLSPLYAPLYALPCLHIRGRSSQKATRATRGVSADANFTEKALLACNPCKHPPALLCHATLYVAHAGGVSAAAAARQAEAFGG